MPGTRFTEVLFVVPPSRWRPTETWESYAVSPLEGATIAATVTREAGYKVACFDLRVTPEAEKEVLRRRNALICLAGTPDGYVSVKDLAAKIKEKDADTPILLGGPLATHSWQTVLRRTRVDYCLLGQCEKPLPRLIDRLANAKEVEQLHGMLRLPVAARVDGEPALFGEQECVNIEEVPLPDYRLWAESYGRSFPPKTVYYSTQRGCPFKCFFCANAWPHQRLSLEKVRRELVALKALGIQEIALSDPTFNSNLGHCEAIIRIMKEDVQLPWTCMIRARPVSEDLFRRMKEAGCYAMFLGIESASDAVLKRSSKQITVHMVEACLDAAQRSGATILGFFLLGLPGETEETLEATHHFICRYTTRAQAPHPAFLFIPRANFPIPFPGTGLFGLYRDHMLKHGRSDLWDEDAVTNEVLTRVSELACDRKDPPFELPGMPKALLQAMLREMAWISAEADRIISVSEIKFR